MNDFRHITIAVVIALLFALACGCIGFVVGFGRGYSRGCQDGCRGLQSTDTIRIHTVDTCFLPSVPDTVLKTVVKYVKVPFYVHHTDTIVDQVEVPLPFEQHFAQLDDVADVWYSGYEAHIDSARLYRRHTTEIVNHYITEPSPRNMVMATAGAVDASLGYLHRFGPVWIGAAAGYTYDGTPTVRGTIGMQF